MGTYRWTSAHHWDEVPGGSDTNPVWWTTGSGANTVLSCASPVGEGDVLVRTEVAAWIGLQATSSYGLGQFFSWQTATHLLGDVSTTGHAPNPAAVGTLEFSFSAHMPWDGNSISFGDPTATYYYFARARTDGYVTSKARRGPDKYGSGHPAFDLGIYTDGSLNWVPGVGGLATRYGFTVRTLWLTP